MSFLFVDRIVESKSGEYIKGIKHINADDFYLTQDEQGAWCFIPSLIGETLGQLAAWNVMQRNEFTLRPVAGVVSCARLHRPAYVGETLLLESYIDLVDDQAVEYHSHARVGDELIFSIEGALGPLLPMAQFIGAEDIKRQFTQINRLGDWAAVKTLTPESLSDVMNSHPERLLSDRAPKIIAPSMTFDRILSLDPGITLKAEKRISKSAAYFSDHFPYKPVLPMTVLLECKINLAKEFIAKSEYNASYHVSELRRIKMNDFILPGDVVICHVKVKQHTDDQLLLSFRSEVDEKRVCVVDLVLTPKR